jgi:hypothetical protein
MKTTKLIETVSAITAFAGLTAVFTFCLYKTLMLASVLIASAPNHGF